MDEVLEHLIEILKKSQVVPVPEEIREQNRKGVSAAYVLFTYPDAPAQYLSVNQVNHENKRLTCVALHPFVRDGLPNTLEIPAASHEDDELHSATLECMNCESMPLSFFDPLYCQQQSLCGKQDRPFVPHARAFRFR